ncbi:MAG: TonB family protein [Bryobacteraceae bacterium]
MPTKIEPWQESRPMANEYKVDLATGRRAAREQLTVRLEAEPELVSRFWKELSNPEALTSPDITLYYAFLSHNHQVSVILEFVAGETLEHLVKRTDPSRCEQAIPMFCHLLDTFEQAGADRSSRSDAERPAPTVAPESVKLVDFGIVRAATATTARLYGSLLVRPDGCLAEEVIGEDGEGHPEVYLLLTTVYQKLMERVPAGAGSHPPGVEQIVVASLASKPGENKFGKGPVSEPAAPVSKPSRSAARVLAAPFIGAVTAIALMALLYGATDMFGFGKARITPISLPPIAASPDAPPGTPAPRSDATASLGQVPDPILSVKTSSRISSSSSRPKPTLTANGGDKPPVYSSNYAAMPRSQVTASTVGIQTPLPPRVVDQPLVDTPVPPTGVTRPARLIRQPKIEYPRLARTQGISGLVRIEVTIAENGSVQKPKVLAGHPMLVAGVSETLPRWRYRPATVDGKAVATTTEIEVRFDLEQVAGKTAPIPPPAAPTGRFPTRSFQPGR